MTISKQQKTLALRKDYEQNYFIILLTELNDLENKNLSHRMSSEFRHFVFFFGK